MNAAGNLGIILCRGLEAAAGLIDFEALRSNLASRPEIRLLVVEAYSEPGQQQQIVHSWVQSENISPVVVAAFDLRHRLGPRIEGFAQAAGINPNLISHADLNLVSTRADKTQATRQALELVRLTASQVALAFPIEIQEIPVITRVLVWGASLAGLKAAAELARRRYYVILAEPGPEVGLPGGRDPVQMAHPQVIASLIEEVRASPHIRILTEARLVDFRGLSGDFEITIRYPDKFLTEKVGAVVLAPDIELIRPESLYGVQPQAQILSQTQLEETLADNSKAEALLPPQADGLKIALLVGLAGESNPVALGRALKSAAELLTRQNCQVNLLTGNAKVAEVGLEQQMQKNQEAGMLLFKLLDPPELTADNQGRRLTFIDPALRSPVEIKPDLVVLDEAYQPAPGNAELAARLGINLAPNGFLQGDNVHNIPVFSNRRGIYLIGPARQVLDLEKAFTDAEDAVLEVEKFLRQGLATAPKGRVQIDRGKCTLCLTCYRLCPHGAITWDHRAIISELACQGCGICASECPMDAIQIQNYTDTQINAALAPIDPELGPRIIAFLCQNSAWGAYEAAVELKHTPLPLGFTPIRVPCAGKVDIDYLLKAFAQGAAGVMVLACHLDNCKSHHGNQLAQVRVESAGNLLTEVGVDPARLVFKTMAANQPREFLEAVEQMSQILAEL